MVRKEVLEQLRQALQQPEAIRNISVIAHVDHGKSTLSDALVASAGLLNSKKAGTERVMDTNKEEKERGITIKSTSISMPFVRAPRAKSARFNPNWPGTRPAEPERKQDQAQPQAQEEVFLINLIDSPGHIDFSSEVSAALRVTDGALVVVDCVESVCVQTKTVLRQAIAERIKPVLFLNKLDRIFMELDMNLEEAYHKLRRSIESVNVVISTYTSSDDPLGDVTVYPEAGTVGFGSGLMGWGFTLRHFADMYHGMHEREPAKYPQFNLHPKKIMKKLWGDNFWDAKKKKFVKEQYTTKGKMRPRAFVAFVLQPLQQLIKASMSGQEAFYRKFLQAQGVEERLPAKKEWDLLRPKDQMKAVMQAWLPCGPCLRDLIIDHLPSPVRAQPYRCLNLYAGPQDDATAAAIRACDPKGPLVMYVSKMVPTSDNSHFFAFGRIFSGTVRAGMEAHIQGPEYSPSNPSSKDVCTKRINGAVVMMGPSVSNVASVPCGNLAGLVGVDQYLVKSGTITTLKNSHNIVDMKYSVAPVVRVAVEPVNAAQLPKLTMGLKRLVKYDPLLKVSTSATGEHVVAGSGELHLEVCLKTLREDFMGGAPIRTSDPVVSYCETIMAPSSQQCLGKSPNKHNRLAFSAEPISAELCTAIEDGVFLNMADKTRASLLVSDYKWDVSAARKVWTFGMPPDGEANVLVDQCKGVAYLHEIKDSVCSAFGIYSNSGVLAQEPMRGHRFNLEDAKVHHDSPHRSPGEIMQASRAALYACQLVSEPRLLEPMYACTIQVPQDFIAGVYSTLRQRRAVIVGTEDGDDLGSPLRTVVAHLPVKESFGFTGLLRKNTSGQAFPQMVFSHWDVVPGDVQDKGSMTYDVLMEIRKRKGLKLELPQLKDYHTKL